MTHRRILEAVLFAASVPQTIEQIALALPDLSIEELEKDLAELRDDYEEEQRGWRLEEIAGGWQLNSHPALHPYVERFLEGRRRARLSRAALEALSVIAYRQPVTRGELEELRGVDCGGVLHTLLDRDLITVRGRSSAIGRPLIYGTTERFLEHFGLDSLSALPSIEEIDALTESAELETDMETELRRRCARLGTPPEAIEESVEGESGGNGGTPPQESEESGQTQAPVPMSPLIERPTEG